MRSLEEAKAMGGHMNETAAAVGRAVFRKMPAPLQAIVVTPSIILMMADANGLVPKCLSRVADDTLHQEKQDSRDAHVRGRK